MKDVDELTALKEKEVTELTEEAEWLARAKKRLAPITSAHNGWQRQVGQGAWLERREGISGRENVGKVLPP